MFLLFLVFPIVEIYLLFLASKSFGFLNVFAFVILTAWVGIRLVRSQGLSILSQLQNEMSAGQVPRQEATSGLLILLAGILLIVPGLITDVLGVLCLIPITRKLISAYLFIWFQKKIKQGNFKIYTSSGFGGFGHVNPGPNPFDIKSGTQIRDVTPTTSEGHSSKPELPNSSK
jgi:UPF0716 protein FxsA